MMGYFRRIFGRSHTLPTPKDRRQWSDDWRRGDLAECVSDPDPLGMLSDSPRVGQTLRVSFVRPDEITTDGTARLHALGFVGKPANHAWANQCFRKLRPSIEAADEEFTAEIRLLTGKSVKEPV